jgi:hypothetical protein
MGAYFGDDERSALRRGLKRVLSVRSGESIAAHLVWMDMIREAIQNRSVDAANDFDELSQSERKRAADLYGALFGISFDSFCQLARETFEKMAAEYPEFRGYLARIDWEARVTSDVPTANDDLALRFKGVEKQLCARLRRGRPYTSAKVRLRIDPDGRVLSHEVCIPLPAPWFCEDIKRAIDPFRIGSDRLDLTGIGNAAELPVLLAEDIIIRMESDDAKRSEGVIFGKEALDDLIWEGVLLSSLAKR